MVTSSKAEKYGSGGHFVFVRIVMILIYGIIFFDRSVGNALGVASWKSVVDGG